MKLLCAGLPLRLRARLDGELPQAEVDIVRTEDELLSALQAYAYPALILREAMLQRPLSQVLDSFPSTFHGAVVLIVQQHHRAADLQSLVRSHHVVSILQEPADPQDLVKALISELGFRRQAEPQRLNPVEELAEVWREHLPTLIRWLEDIEAVLDAQHRTEADLVRALHGARSLVNNFGSFGLESGTLLAREAQRLLDAAAENAPLRVERLGLVLEALHQLLRDRPGPLREPSRIVVVSEDMNLFRELDLEARLLNWVCESCSELSDLPSRLSLARTRAVIVDADAPTCLRQPRLLAELVIDPLPTVVIGQPPLPNDTPGTLWMESGSSAYRLVLAALRCQLTEPGQPPFILVVDDDSVTRAVVERTLHMVDFHVETLPSGLEFWDVLESNRPDLVLLAMDLPTLSGLELCRAIRLDDRYCTLPVILTTDKMDTRTRQRAYEAGADDLLYKPLFAPELRTRISNRLERCRQRAAHAVYTAAPGRTYTTLGQLILRSLRLGMPLLLAVVDLFAGGMRRRHVAQALRGTLRGEDVVRPLGDTRLLVGMLTPSLERARERFAQILQRLEPDARVAFSWMGEENPDFNVALEQAVMQLETDTSLAERPCAAAPSSLR